MLEGENILCISSIDWDFIWQGHQEIMATLAEQGNRVLFVENTGVRTPGLGDLPRLRQRIRNWWSGVKGFRSVQENLVVYSPLILPFPYSRVARWVNRTLLVRVLRRWMQVSGFHRPIIWTFLPTPLVRDLIRALDPKLTIYYCIDDLSSSSPAAYRIRRSETVIFREADLVFVTSEKLRERAARVTERVHLFPFGVNYRQFEAIRNGPDEIPRDLREIPRPMVGYVGGIHQWLDQELLAAVAARMPEASFVLVGPRQTDVSRLARCPNIILLGPRPHESLPQYIKGFDVGLIPYRLSEYTASVYPTKLNEYLAMGIPVVATDLPEVRRFNAEQGDLVAVADDAEAFAGAIREGLTEASRAEAERRIDAARQSSWENRIARMSDLIVKALEAKRRAEKGWEESLRHLYWAARRRTVLTATVAIGLYLLLFSTPLLWGVAKPLRVVEPVRPADAIVVFAGGVGESGRAGGGYKERVKRAVALYHDGYATRLIFSSGFAVVFQEADIMKALAVSLGVPAGAIILEERATSTYENVVFVGQIVRSRGWRRILLVSSPYHMRRAFLTFRKLSPDLDVISAPADESQFYAHRWGASSEQIGGILHEYAAIVVYWWRGWL